MSTYNTKFISGEPVSVGVKATGTITIANNALLPADWIQVDGSIQLVPGTDFVVGVDAIATARNLRDRLNAPNDLGVVATSSNNVITLVATYPGTAGNSIGLSAFSAKYTLSGANLTGGTDVAGTAFILDTAINQTLAAAKLLSIKNASVEKAYLDRAGNLRFTHISTESLIIGRTAGGSGGSFQSIILRDGTNGDFVFDGGGSFYYSSGTTYMGTGPFFKTGPGTAGMIQASPLVLAAQGGAGSFDCRVPIENTQAGILGGRVALYDDIVIGSSAGTTNRTMYSNRTDSATSIGFIFDTDTTFANATSRLASFKNAGVEKLTIDKNGGLRQVGELDVVSTTDYAEGAGYSKAWLQLVGSAEYWMLEAFKDSDSSDVFIDGLANGASSGMTMIIDGGTGNPGGSVKLQNYASGNYGGVGGKDLAFAFDPPTISGWASFIGLTGDGWFSGGAGATITATKEWDFLSQARDDSDSNAYWFDTHFSLTSPTAKLAVLANAGAEKFSIGINGGINVRRSSTASSVSSAGEVIIGVTDTSAVRTVTLDSDDLVAGRIVIVKDESGAAGTNNITVKTEGGAGCTIDGVSGATGVPITANYGCLRLYSNGTNWFTW